LSGAQGSLEAAKLRGKQIESERKQLELDVEAKKTQIEKYANQQLQTRKNEEYRALAHEIETCKADIHKIEDKEIELMEQGSRRQGRLGLHKEADAAKKLVEDQIKQLGGREENLSKELAELQSKTARNWRERWTTPPATL